MAISFRAMIIAAAVSLASAFSAVPAHVASRLRPATLPQILLSAEKEPAARGRGSPTQVVPRGGSGRGRGRGQQQQRGRGRGRGASGAASERRDRLRKLCAAIRASEKAAVDETLAGPVRWSDGEWRAMLQAASQITDWQTALRLLRRMEEAGRPYDAEAYAYAIATCSKANEPNDARALLERLGAAGVAVEARSHNQVISSWSRSGQWKEALRQLDATPAEIRTVVTYNAALSGMSAAARWSEALDLLGRMERDGPTPDVVSYSTAAAACQKAKRWEPALGLLQRLEAGANATAGGANATDDGPALPAPNVFTYTSAVVALAEAGKWQEAVRTYEGMPAHLERNDAIINAAVSAAAAGGAWQVAVGILHDAIAAGTSPRVSSFNMAFNSLADGRQPAEALGLLRRMRDASSARPNLLTYNAVLRTLEKAGRWRQAARLLRDMRREKVRPSLISFNLALGACAKGAKKDKGSADAPAALPTTPTAPRVEQSWEEGADNGGVEAEAAAEAAAEMDDECATAGEQAEKLLLEAQRWGVRPDVVSYSSAIAALAARGEYERVIGLIGAMQEEGVEPTTFSWTAAIAACERAGEWQKALGLFNGLREAGGGADLPTWHAAISAAGSSGKVELAKSLLEEMRAEEGLNVTLRAYNGVLKACERAADWDAAIDLMVIMKAEGLAPDKVSYTSTVGAAGRAGEWEKALGLWQQMLAEGIDIDSLALHNLLRAVTLAGQSEVALFVFGRALKTAPSVCTSTVFSAALEACAASAQRDRALALLQAMSTMRPRVFPSPACYHYICAACAADDDWKGALSAVQDMLREDMQPQDRTWQVVLAACRKAGRDEEADQLSEYAERIGVPLLALGYDEDGEGSAS